VHKLIRWRLPVDPFLGLVLAAVLTMLPVGKAMAFFDFMKINVFSDVDGIVTLNGEPVSGATVKQYAEVEFNSNKFNREVVTDSQGRFHFDAIYARTMNTFLSSANMVSQLITIHYEGRSYDAWRKVKGNYDYGGELNNIKDIVGERDEMKVFSNKLSSAQGGEKIIPLNFTCELTDDDSTL